VADVTEPHSVLLAGHDVPLGRYTTVRRLLPHRQRRMATEAARCFHQLGLLTAARQQAECVVTLRPRERARSRAFAQLILIAILITEGRPDEACAVGHAVLQSTRALGSLLVVQQLEQLGRLLMPFRRNHEVAAFLDCLRTELPERRWLAQWLSGAELPVEGEATT
jgi:hypothetical protein